jgi:preprotein translocase subunit SecE
MALNREQKRRLQRSGDLAEAGEGDLDLDVASDEGGGADGGGSGGDDGSGGRPRGRGRGDDDGGSPRKGRATPSAKGDSMEERTSPRQFLREVRGELRKVAWPTRSETLNYSLVVALTLVFMTTLIFGLDWIFGEAVMRLFDVGS